MNKIDSSHCPIIECNFDLYKSSLLELKELAKSWYKHEDFSKFDNRYVRDREEGHFKEMKKSGLMCNYFFAYEEDGKRYLLDGFNRLFTDYGDISSLGDIPVYLKVITDKLEDHELMAVMFRLNMWKLQERGFGGFRTEEFLDRGFRLLLKEKFNIELSDKYGPDHKRKNSDFHFLRNYFINESESCGDYTFGLYGTSKLFSHKNVINDFREILSLNTYEEPFKNYRRFVEGFVMFLAYRRVIVGDDSEIKFKTYLDKLEADKKFFNKLQGMSWTDSTRKNVYKFFRDIK